MGVTGFVAPSLISKPVWSVLVIDEEVCLANNCTKEKIVQQ
ncbi:hypothetical protein NQ318_003245 [Aromia moschata]|uniref:Uncharacterized protein n=1 Tax=Aromia moschata TaxID=1265417 RepID=A0AAV8X681_9CUCU|nr:hypothetical protein NQ318_003245 [Aromia moschata]